MYSLCAVRKHSLLYRGRCHPNRPRVEEGRRPTALASPSPVCLWGQSLLHFATWPTTSELHDKIVIPEWGHLKLLSMSDECDSLVVGRSSMEPKPLQLLPHRSQLVRFIDLLIPMLSPGPEARLSACSLASSFRMPSSWQRGAQDACVTILFIRRYSHPPDIHTC